MPPKKFLGRHIIFREEYAEKLIEGSKTTTIRRGIVRPRYRQVIIHAGSRPIALARVEYVYYKRLRDISESEARRDGFESRAELVSELRKIYPGIRDDEYVTVIGLRVVKRLDTVDTGKPFGGLEPVVLARIALRYLSDVLTDSEVKVLLDLTRTGDIDLTAARVLGDVGKRGVVVDVLNRALRMLVEKGILREKG
ncbi:MAG: ASCH domain-containing protein [Thermogladius sp.]